MNSTSAILEGSSWKNRTIILRVSLFATLIAHSIPSIVSGDVNGFGKLYLDAIGFAPFGLVLAWAIKLSHVACAFALLLNKYVKIACVITIFILVMGIILIHFREGWFVVGFGRNGMEFNVLLISVLVYLMAIDKKRWTE
jgi:putative oxidoreductase